MRQAGRYLPEYREVRAQAKDFVALCLTPTLTAELTLQPVRRYGMNAAILFSDILMLPYALGQSVSFRDGEGPVLEPITDNIGVAQLEKAGAIGRLEPVFDAVRRVTAALGPETALIGFAGAPWTVATYMVEGGTSRDFRRVKTWAYRDPEGFAALIENPGRNYDRASVGADFSRCGDRSAIRQLGRRFARSRVRTMGHCADKGDRCRVEEPASRLSDHRLSTWRRLAL